MTTDADELEILIGALSEMVVDAGIEQGDVAMEMHILRAVSSVTPADKIDEIRRGDQKA